MRLTDPRLEMPLVPPRRAKIILAATLAACFLLMSAQTHSRRGGPSLLEQMGLVAATPVVAAAQAGTQTGRDMMAWVTSYFGARSENQRLKRAVVHLQDENLILRAQEQASSQLRALLGAREFLPSVRRAASIVAVTSEGSYRRVLLDAGSSDGVVADTPLVVPEGLVGRVTTVSPSLSKAIFITDGDCAVGARITRTGDQGVVRGQGDNLRMDYLSALSGVRPGDTVETAGIDGIFPSGIPIGTVTSVARGKDLFLQVEVAPSAPLHRLSDVLLLLPSPATGTRP